MEPIGSVGGLSVSGVFSQMFAALAANWIFVLLIFAPAHFAVTLGWSITAHQSVANPLLQALLPWLWQVPVLAAHAVLQGLFTLKVIGGETGGPLPISEAAQLALGRALVFGVVGALTYLGFTLGLIVLIVPGVIFSLATTLAVPVAAIEDTNPFKAIARSFTLTRGRRGAILGLTLIQWIPLIIVSFVAEGIITGGASLVEAARDPRVLYGWTPAFSIVSGTLAAAFQTIIYRQVAQTQMADRIADHFD